MTATPIVSVLMLAYNRAHYMRQAIASVLTQTFANFEFIILDNGSQDDAVYAIAQEYAAKDPRIILHRESKHLGISAGRQLALQLARGKYITMLDDDDWWRADKLQTQVSFMQAHPQVGLCSCSRTYIDANGRELRGIGGIADSIDPPTTALDGDRPNEKFLGAGFIARRDALLQCGGFRPFFRLADDHDLGYRIRETAATAVQSERLLYWRISHGAKHQRVPNKLYVAAADISAHHRRSNLPDPIADDTDLDDLLIRHFHACPIGRTYNQKRMEWYVARAFLYLGKYAQLRRFLRASPPRGLARNLWLYGKLLFWSAKFNRLGFWTGAASAAKQPS